MADRVNAITPLREKRAGAGNQTQAGTPVLLKLIERIDLTLKCGRPAPDQPAK
jgi:hypothetical protein